MAAASTAAPGRGAGAGPPPAPGPGPGRLAAIDRMRGWVMVLMALDHASALFNGRRVSPDSVWFGELLLRAELEWGPYLTRWVTHVCAPTFVFLAGTAMALSVERRIAAGESARAVDRHLLTRGAFIVALDFVWMCWANQGLVVQVLYAIGASMMCMVLLRRLPTAVLVALAAGWLVGGEWVLARLGHLPPTVAFPRPDWGGLGSALLVVPAFFPPAPVYGSLFEGSLTIVIYPLVPWLAMLVLGWAFGRHLLNRRGPRPAARTARLLLAAGLASLAAYAALRWLDGYGNLGMRRWDDAPLRWLQVNKYPPSLAFALSQLGLMAVLLAGLFALDARRSGPPWRFDPLLVLGRSALFFYVLHIHLLALVAHLFLGGPGRLGLASAYVGALLLCAALYPLCLAFARYKAAHPRGLARYF